MSESGEHKVSGASYFGGAAAGLVVVWGWFCLEQFTNLRVTRAFGTAQEEPISVIFPIATTVIAPLVALFFWRRAVGIAANGVATSATVLSVSNAVQNMRNVQFSYSFAGSEYTKTVSIITVISDKLSPGDPLAIIVDGRKPTRVLVK